MGFFIGMLLMLAAVAFVFLWLYQFMQRRNFQKPIPLVFSCAVAGILVPAGFYLLALLL